MKILFAGASGVIGPRLLPALLDTGYDVVALTRTPAKAAGLEAAGATPAVCDALDADAVSATVAEHRPDAIVNHLTDLSGLGASRGAIRRAYQANDRLRRVGSQNLMAAAAESGVERVVAQTICFIYRPGPGLRSESDPLAFDAPDPFADSVRAVDDMERIVLGADGVIGTVLRFGYWYGPGTGFDRGGDFHELVRRRRFPIVGPGSGVWSFVHIDDVVAATITALERGKPGIYNVCDDDPAPSREWLPVFAEAIGAPAPRRVPVWLARLVAGPLSAYLATDLAGASNAKAKAELGFSPSRPSWRHGFREQTS